MSDLRRMLAFCSWSPRARVSRRVRGDGREKSESHHEEVDEHHQTFPAFLLELSEVSRLRLELVGGFGGGLLLLGAVRLGCSSFIHLHGVLHWLWWSSCRLLPEPTRVQLLI